MSAVGTTLQHSPGWNEGKARNGTLGTHERKVISSSVGAALTTRVLALRCGCAAPTGLNQWLENEKPRANALGFQRLFRNLQHICYNLLKLDLFF